MSIRGFKLAFDLLTLTFTIPSTPSPFAPIRVFRGLSLLSFAKGPVTAAVVCGVLCPLSFSAASELSDSAFRTGLAQENLRQSAGAARTELRRLRAEMLEVFPGQAPALDAAFRQLETLSETEMRRAVERLQAAARGTTPAAQLQALTAAREDQTAIESALQTIAFQLTSQKTLQALDETVRDTARKLAMARADTARIARRPAGAEDPRRPLQSLSQDQKELTASAGRIAEILARTAPQLPPGPLRDAAARGDSLTTDMRQAAQALEAGQASPAADAQLRGLGGLKTLLRALTPADQPPELRRLHEARRALEDLAGRQEKLRDDFARSAAEPLLRGQDRNSTAAAALEPFLDSLSPLAAGKLAEATRLMEAAGDSLASHAAAGVKTPSETAATQARDAHRALEEARRLLEIQIARLEAAPVGADKAAALEQLAREAAERAAEAREAAQKPADQKNAAAQDLAADAARLAEAATTLQPEAAAPLSALAEALQDPARLAEAAPSFEQAARQLSAAAAESRTEPAQDPRSTAALALARAAEASARAREAQTAGNTDAARDQLAQAAAQTAAARENAAALSPEARTATQAAAAEFEAARQTAREGQNPTTSLLAAETQLAAAQMALARQGEQLAATPTPAQRQFEAARNLARAAVETARANRDLAQNPQNLRSTAQALEQAAGRLHDAARQAAQAGVPGEAQAAIEAAARSAADAQTAAEGGQPAAARAETAALAENIENALDALGGGGAPESVHRAMDQALTAQNALTPASSTAPSPSAAGELGQAAKAASGAGQDAPKAAGKLGDASADFTAAQKAAGEGRGADAAMRAAEGTLAVAEARAASLTPPGAAPASQAAQAESQMARAADAAAAAQQSMAQTSGAAKGGPAGALAQAAQQALSAQQGASPQAQASLGAAAAQFQAARQALQQGQTSAAQAAATEAQQALAQAQQAQAAASAALAQSPQGPTGPSDGAAFAPSSNTQPPGQSQGQADQAQGGGLGFTNNNMASSGDEGTTAQVVTGLSPRDRAAAAQLQAIKPPPEFVPEVRQYYQNLADDAAP